MSQIFLGYPPPKIKEFIIEHYSPIDMTKVPLTFTAEEAGAKLSLQSYKGPAITLETSPTGEEGSWTPYTVGTEITLANVGDKVMFRNSSDTIQVMSTFESEYNYFKIDSGKIAASGNIMFLMDKTGELRDLSGKDYCYSSMFQNCTSLTQAPELPATTLASNCYRNMFGNCNSLTKAPELPATNLAYGCYSGMLWNCNSLTKAPELPATTLANFCYGSMFDGCTSLTQAPELPATNLAEGCYNYMFQSCTSLTQAPELPATNLAYSCYSQMFSGCTSLTQALVLPATNLATQCYYQMLDIYTNIPEPRYNMSHMTFNEVANAIQNNQIFYEEETCEIQCSDKIAIVSFNWDTYEWTVTEK